MPEKKQVNAVLIGKSKYGASIYRLPSGAEVRISAGMPAEMLPDLLGEGKFITSAHATT